MPVNRISKEAIMKMKRGQVNVADPAACVIKFYSNNCHLCHALSTYYRDISDSYEDVMFFAYNVDDDESISEMLDLNGVPSITMFKIKKGVEAVVKNLADPENPNKETWFTVKEIKNFIDKEAT
jgi:thiol-disulfide isomerase/thioredoxin